jgi:PqqD family protein of HPr-rel-A system
VIAPKTRGGIQAWPVGDEVVIYEPRTGMGHVLNPAAVRILAMCDGTTSVEAMEEELVATFPENPNRIRSDLRSTLAVLDDRGLIEPLMD